MSKNILLIDVDSKIPNLALMKLSAHHKKLNDNIKLNKNITYSFHENQFDHIYASIIFKRNKHVLDGINKYYKNVKIDIGGSGHNLNKKLPNNIELLKPDYLLYPEIDYSIGYSSRGCNRNCSFCIVPQKEGKFYRTQHPQEWYNSDFNKIIFLDNNILLDRGWFFIVTDFCIKNKLKTWFTQGLDIRLLDDDIAQRLKQIHNYKGMFFAWDNINDEKIIIEKINILKKFNINLRSLVNFYVYVKNDADFDSGVYRCRMLKSLNCNPFVMFDIDRKRTKRIQQLQRWSNRRNILWSCDIDEYRKNINQVKFI